MNPAHRDPLAVTKLGLVERARLAGDPGTSLLAVSGPIFIVTRYASDGKTVKKVYPPFFDRPLADRVAKLAIEKHPDDIVEVSPKEKP